MKYWEEVVNKEDVKRLLEQDKHRDTKITIIPKLEEMDRNRDWFDDIDYVQGILDVLEPGDRINFFPPILVNGKIVAPRGVTIEGLSDSREYPRYRPVHSNL